MFSKLQEIWNEWGFEILLAICIIFILLYALYSKIKGAKGTWTKQHFIGNYHNDSMSKQQSRVPASSKGEIECRKVLQEIFGRSFNKARPDFLRNPVTGGYFNLELDCFDSELRIAVEYNGIQHYQYVSYFHKNKEAFLNQKYRDDMKRRICRENGILLIEVPYTVKNEEIRSYIEAELTRNRIQF